MLSKHTLWHCTGVRKEGRKVGAMCAQHTFLGFMKSLFDIPECWHCMLLGSSYCFSNCFLLEERRGVRSADQ